jgi:hypothetical protein
LDGLGTGPYAGRCWQSLDFGGRARNRKTGHMGYGAGLVIFWKMSFQPELVFVRLQMLLKFG